MEARSGEVKAKVEEAELLNNPGELKKESSNEKNEQLGAQNDALKYAAAGSRDLGAFQLWENSPRPMGPNSLNFSPNQLTIFYNGCVNVFDGIAAEKVREIMLIAATAAASAKPGEVKSTGNYFPPPSPVLTRSPSMQSTSTALASPNPQIYPIQNNPLCKLQADLPIARRHSLQRFFQKRRDRLVNKAPYPSTTMAKTAEEKETNLGTVASPEMENPSVPLAENQLNASAQLA